MFANMTYDDRVAFFDLMDEYFASRPNLFKNAGGGSNSNGSNTNSTPAGVATSHLQTFASKNPAMTSSLISSGISHQAAANPQSKWSGALSNPKVAGALGKMGAAGLASGAAPPNGGGGGASTEGGKPAAPPAPLRRGEQKGLTSSKTFGHLDTSSGMGALKTMFKDPQAPKPAYVPPPSTASSSSSSNAYSRPKNNLPPPPVRRVTPQQKPEPEPEPEYYDEPAQEEEAGDYAEAMYAYDSSEPTDLALKAKDVVLILEKTSADWWKARNPQTGKEGLIPAAYVKEI